MFSLCTFCLCKKYQKHISFSQWEKETKRNQNLKLLKNSDCFPLKELSYPIKSKLLQIVCIKHNSPRKLSYSLRKLEINTYKFCFIVLMYSWTFNFAIMKLTGTGKHYYLSDKFMHRIFSFLLTFFFSRKEKSVCILLLLFLCKQEK